ncbi:hypothetical protein F4804DRAFT_327757 [Jackrogersella minutella]|nr:hypothetical protein F4804DRAFT_327757 [Jackrogersella minutella]
MASEAGPSRPVTLTPLDVSAQHDAAPRPRANSTSMPRSAVDPVLRNALRYTISAREYETLHRYVLSRSRVLRKRVPSVGAIERYMDGATTKKGSMSDKDSSNGKETPVNGDTGRGDTYNARAIRDSLRVFIATGLGMRSYEAVLTRLKAQKEGVITKKQQPFHKSSGLRLSLSLSMILLLYRLLFRFLSRLRAHLLDQSAAPFRTRNPRTSQALTSPYAPAVGASLAGLALGISSSQQLRVTVAIAAIFRALEFGWNLCEDEGLIWGWKTRAGGKGMVKRDRPWWWGSWMLQPFAFGQLLHAAVFDRESSPVTFVDFIWKSSTTYLHSAPKDLPATIKWPNAWEVAETLSQMAKLSWPPFVSPTLFPEQETLPSSLTTVAPLVARAHPLITSLSCATLHPSDPSCLRTYLTFWVRSFPRMGRFFLLFYSVLMLPQYKLLYNSPMHLLNRLLSKVIRISTFTTGAISTAWASVCFFQTWLPRTFLPTQRFFLGGFLAGMWAWLERKEGRGVFLYSARASVDSLWKVGTKRRWWRAMKGGDVWLFVLALAITGAVYERDAKGIRESNVRKGVSWARGAGFKDWGMEENEENDNGNMEN